MSGPMSPAPWSCRAFASTLAAPQEVLLGPGTLLQHQQDDGAGLLAGLAIPGLLRAAREACCLVREAGYVAAGDALVGTDVWAAACALQTPTLSRIKPATPLEAVLQLLPSMRLPQEQIQLDIYYTLDLPLATLAALFEPAVTALAAALIIQLETRPIQDGTFTMVEVAGTRLLARVELLDPADAESSANAKQAKQGRGTTAAVFVRPCFAPKVLDSRDYVDSNVLTRLAIASPAVFLKHALLLVGPAGCGKSTLAHQCAQAAGCPFAIVSLPALLPVTGDLRVLEDVLDKVELCAPAVLVLDDLDVLCHVDHENLRTCAELLATRLERWSRRPRLQAILVLGLVRSAQHLPRCLRAVHAFDEVLAVALPTKKEREASLRRALLPAAGLDPEWASVLVTATHGFSYRDLRNWLQLGSLRRVATPADLLAMLSAVPPAARSQYAATLLVVPWTAFAGYHKIRTAARAVLRRFMQGCTESDFGLPSGMLLYGPSGCGKSVLVAALATECQLNVIVGQGPALFGKYVGETEENIRNMFAAARESRPCVLFVDHIEVLAQPRGNSNSSTGVEERALSQLLNEMDGIQSRDGIFFLACTSRSPAELDAAMLRPGRLEMVFEMQLPSATDRHEIVDLLATRWPVDAELDRSALVVASAGCTGAQLQAAFKAAGRAAFHRRAKYISLCDFGGFVAASRQRRHSINLLAAM